MSPATAASPAIQPLDAIRAQADGIRASGVLGRSGQLLRLFEYLVACSETGRTPKEIEVAIDGFGRDAGFDVSQDALVRVYVHKLRRRLDAYYEGPQGRSATARLVVPRGEYRLELEPVGDPAEPAPAASPAPGPGPVAAHVPASRRSWTGRERGFALVAAVLAVVCIALFAERGARPAPDARLAAARASPIWAPLLADDRPIQLVLGDYFIFGERNAFGRIDRLVRDFTVNSRGELERRLQGDPGLTRRYVDLGLGYLPTSSAWALREVLPLLAASGKPVRVSLASELDPAAFKSAHIVYIGYLSGMGMLLDLAFQHSRFQIGSSYDELVDAATGETYLSEAGEPVDASVRYRDYAYVSSFRGQNGNQHVIIAGARDTALIQAGEIAADPVRLAELSSRSNGAPDFEALYEVQGMSRMNLEARLVLAAPIIEAQGAITPGS